jgi:hypothetical protein
MIRRHATTIVLTVGLLINLVVGCRLVNMEVTARDSSTVNVTAEQAQAADKELGDIAPVTEVSP